MRVGAYPGTFDPPTIAHLAVAEAALNQGGLDAVHLVVSREPLGKAPSVPSLEDRLAVLEEVASTRDWLGIRVTDHRLIADVATGYDAVIMGMDKWLQVLDPAWYGGSAEARDAALAALPDVLLVGRHGSAPTEPFPRQVRFLEVHPAHGPVSSTLVRAGRAEWMLEEAARFDARTGAWTDQGRYRAGGAPTAPVDPASLPSMPAPDQPRG